MIAESPVRRLAGCLRFGCKMADLFRNRVGSIGGEACSRNGQTHESFRAIRGLEKDSLLALWLSIKDRCERGGVRGEERNVGGGRRRLLLDQQRRNS